MAIIKSQKVPFDHNGVKLLSWKWLNRSLSILVNQLDYPICKSLFKLQVNRMKIDDFRQIQVWRRRWFTSNVHGSPFLFFDLRGDSTGKLVGIGKIVNDESCSTRRALLAYQLSFETVENPRSSMPNLLIFFDIF